MIGYIWMSVGIYLCFYTFVQIIEFIIDFIIVIKNYLNE